MTDPQTIVAEEEPLDPAMEKVRRKLVRLLAVSIGIMMAGVLAVLFAVVWRINSDPTPTLAVFDLVVPSDLEIRSVQAGEDRISILGSDAAGNVRLLVFDANNGAPVANAQIVRDGVPE